MKNKERDRVAGLVLKNDKILLMFRRNNGREYFTFPGGGIENGETNEAALEREMLEETTVKIKTRSLLYRARWNKKSYQYFYLCSYLSGEPILGDFIEKEVMKTDKNQHYEPMWKKIGDLESLIVYPLEARDLLIKDLKSGFSGAVKELTLDLATCRQE